MEAYQQRVIDEKKALDEKIEKLDAFLDTDLFRSLSPDDGSLLMNQQHHMKAYSQVLAQRIERFK